MMQPRASPAIFFSLKKSAPWFIYATKLVFTDFGEFLEQTLSCQTGRGGGGGGGGVGGTRCGGEERGGLEEDNGGGSGSEGRGGGERERGGEVRGGEVWIWGGGVRFPLEISPYDATLGTISKKYSFQ